MTKKGEGGFKLSRKVEEYQQSQGYMMNNLWLQVIHLVRGTKQIELCGGCENENTPAP